MIKRNKQNIGKTVRIIGHKYFDGRLGTVKGFRGDFAKGDPVVCVYVDSVRSVWPFPGSSLEVQKTR